MTKQQMVEFISGTYPNIQIRNYKGEEGYIVLQAICSKVRKRHDEKRAEEQRQRGLFS